MRNLSADLRWLSINTITVDRQGDLCAIIDACAAHGIRAVALWRHQVAAVGLQRTVRLLRDAGVVCSNHCRGGMFVADRDRIPAMREDNKRALEEASALGAPCLVIVPGGLPQFSRPGSAASKDIAAARGMIVDELGELLRHAKAAGIPLALEPLHPMLAADRGCVNTLRQAVDICEALDPDCDGGLGVVVDAYHCWWDPELRDQIGRAGRSRLLVFQVCDWLVPMNHLLNDRGMMGDGVIELGAMRDGMEAAGFSGYVEVEIFSEQWWRQPIDRVLEVCIERYRSHV